MATLTPTQNSADVEKQNDGQPTGGGREPGVWAIPGSFNLGRRRIEVARIEVGDKIIHPTASGGIHLKSKDSVRFFGSGLDVYYRAEFLGEGSDAVLDRALITSQDNGAVISFTVPDFDNSVKDGGYFWLRLSSRSVPQANRTISPYLVYQIEETKDQAEKRKVGEAAGREGEGGDAGARVVSEILNAGLGPIGAVAGTLAASSVGAKTISKSGTAGASSVVKKATDEASGGGYDQTETEETISQPITSTSEVSTGGRTISESGTISSGGQTVGGGSTQISQTISSGGTAGASGTVTARERVSSAVSGGVAGGGTTSGTTSVSSRTTAGGQTNTSAAVTGQSSVTGQASVTGQRGGGAGGSSEAKVTGTANQGANLQGKAETKTEVSAGQAGGSNQPPTKSSAPAQNQQGAPSTATGQAVGKSTISGTAGLGTTFGSGTNLKAPAGLGNMLKNSAALNLNISSGGTSAPQPVGKPSSSEDNQNKTAPAGEGENEPPKEQPPETPEEAPEASPKGDEGKNLLAPEPVAETAPKGEEKPASEAAPGPVRPARPLNDTRVSSPLGPDALKRSPENKPDQQSPNNAPVDGISRPLNKEAPELSAPRAEGDGLPPAISREGEPQSSRPSPSEPDLGADSKSAPLASRQTAEGENETPKQAGGGSSAGTGTAGALIRGAGKKGVKGFDIAEAQPIANKAVNSALNDAAATIWAAAIPTFGLSILLGAIIGDILWLIKDWLAEKILSGNPLLKAIPNLNLRDLKIKFSLLIKLQIIAMNLIVAILVVLFVVFVMAAGCNWPVPGVIAKHVNYKVTVIGAFIGDDCKYFDTSNLIPTGGASPSPTAPVTPRSP
jgi:hypothetical protein